MAASRAGAEAPVETYRLAWVRGDGAEACPSETDLAGYVAARLQRQPFADTAPRTIEGSVTREGDTWRASLRVRDEHGRGIGSRDFETVGDDCGALAAAATLAVVLTIDPSVSLTASEIPSASFPLAAPAEPVPARAASAETRPTEAPTPERTTPACALSRTPERRATVSAAAVLSAGVLPEVAFGAALEARVPKGPIDFVLGMRLLPSATSEDGHLGVNLMTGQLGAYRGFRTGSVELGLAGSLEAGVLTLVARDLTPVDPGPYPWVALQAGPRGVWPADAPVALELGALALVPFTRQQFRVEGAVATPFQTNAVSFIASAGVRLRSP